MHGMIGDRFHLVASVALICVGVAIAAYTVGYLRGFDDSDRRTRHSSKWLADMLDAENHELIGLATKACELAIAAGHDEMEGEMADIGLKGEQE